VTGKQEKAGASVTGSLFFVIIYLWTMKKRGYLMRNTLFLVFAVLLLQTHVFAADTVYVQSIKAKIMSEPKFSAKVVDTLQRGDKLTALETKGRWYKASTGKITGWINKLCVTQQPPMKKVTAIKGDTRALEENARQRASAITSAAAARGLSAADRKRLSQVGLADYDALIVLEGLSSKISDQDITQFMETEGEKQ